MSSDPFKVTVKQITVAGRKFTVCKATFEAQLKRFTLMEQVEKSLNGNGELQPEDGLEAFVRLGFKKITYPSLASCTSGRLFTEDECFRIEQDELDKWLSAARELNPSWFPSVAGEAEADTLQKKETPG